MPTISFFFPTLNAARLGGWLLPAAVIFHGASPVWAAEFYVAPTGSDGNSCASVAAPCRTMTGAIEKAACSGDTINATAREYQAPLVSPENPLLQGAGAAGTIGGQAV
jgi:hypothetical protein